MEPNVPSMYEVGTSWYNQKMRRTESAGGVVLNKDGNVLIVDQIGSWSLPKGHIEQGEDALEAAKREIYEESGVEILELIKELGSYERPSMRDPNELKTIFMFLFNTTQMDLKPIDKNNPEAKWLKPSEILEKLTHQKDKEFFLSVMKFLK